MFPFSLSRRGQLTIGREPERASTWFMDLIRQSMGSGRRVRLDITDLPPGLKQDIGFTEEGAGLKSFDERWQRELKDLTR